MQAKKRLLVVGDYSRKDFLDNFYACREDFDFYFIEFASPAEVTSDYYKNYGQAIFWKDFSDAFDLLEKVNPYKVIFYFIESYNHIALNVASKQTKIKTYHLDHGIRDLGLEAKLLETQNSVLENTINRLSGLALFLSKFKGFKTKLKNRLFFVNTVRKSHQEAKAFLQQYYQIRKINSIRKTFELVISRFRVADEYISFSKPNFKQYLKQDHLEANYPVHYIGVPTFDKWANLKPAPDLKNYLVFITQPFVEQGWLGWTAEFEQNFIEQFVKVCQDKEYKLLVKLHPYQNSAVWQYYCDKGAITLVSETDMLKIMTETKIVAGFFSTLLFPLAALPHITTFTFENHPVGTIFPSAVLSKASVSYQLNSVQELGKALDNQTKLHFDQVKAKRAFAVSWLGCFDGWAGERLKLILFT